MDKFEYGAYNSQTYEHESPFADSSYIDPVNETETRKQFSYPLLELQDFINKTLPIQQGSDKVIQLRLTSDNLIQYSLDGETWLDTASGGHIIYDEDENQLPQKTKLRFDGVSVFNSGDFTIVKGLKGEQGVSVASIVQVSESSESEGLNVWRATLTDGSTFDFVVRNGHKGEQGEKGEQGNGLIILGTYASLEDLQVAHPTGNEGDLYVVGTSDSNPCYVWDTNDNAWESIGKIRGEKGAKGDKGETGEQGTSVQSIVTQESSVSGGTNIVTITLTNGAINTFNIKNGEKGEAGEGMKSGGTIGQVLAKKTSTDYDCIWTTIDKDSIGLGNVDNTADLDKPISTLTQNALDNKQLNLNLTTNNAGFHNSIFRGKYLGTSVTSTQYAQISAGTFEDLYIGDYWTINGVNWRIAGFDYWYNRGDTACTTHHIVIVPDSNLLNADGSTKWFNASNTTTGAYVGSDWYTGNNSNTGRSQVTTKINNAFGSAHILTHREYLKNAVTNGYESGGSWYDSTHEFMTEQMAYGCKVFGNVINGTNVPASYTISNSQLPLFALAPQYLCNRAFWWLRDVVSSTLFALVNNYGDCTCTNASTAWIGVRVAFGVKA